MSYLDYAKKVLSELVSIPTPNPPGEGYKEISVYLEEKLRDLGFAVKLITVSEDFLDSYYPYAPLHRGKPRIIVYGKLLGENSNPVVQFNGHYDVVPPGEGWRRDPYKAVEENGCIYGRGTSDMKAGIAATLAAIKKYLDEGNTPNGSLEVVFVPDEETGGLGTRYFLKTVSEKPSFVIIGEPTWPDKIVVGHRGILRALARVFGKQVHGSMPWRGENAFIHASRLVLEFLKAYTPILFSRRTGFTPDSPDPQAWYPSINIGGYAESLSRKENTVPGEFVFSIDRRLIAEEDPESTASEMTRVFEEVAKRLKLRAEIIVQHKIPPAVSTGDSRLVESFKQCLWEMAGLKASTSVSLIRSDATYYIMEGVKAVNYGPGDPLKAHVVEECVKVERIEEVLRVYECVIKKLLGYQKKTLE